MARTGYYGGLAGLYGGQTPMQQLAQGYELGTKIGGDIGGLVRDKYVNDYEDEYVKQATREDGSLDLNLLDSTGVTDPRRIQAIGNIRKRYLDDAKGREEIMQAQDQNAINAWKTFATNFAELESLSGDPSKQTAIVERIINSSNNPYKVKFDPKTGMYNATYQDRNGDVAMPQQYSHEQIMSLLGEMKADPKKFYQQYQRANMALVAANSEYMSNPTTWFTASDGNKTLTLVPHKRATMNGIEQGFLVLDKSGKTNDFMNFQQLSQMGIDPSSFMKMGEQRKLDQQERMARIRHSGGSGGGLAGATTAPAWGENEVKLFKSFFDEEVIPELFEMAETYSLATRMPPSQVMSHMRVMFDQVSAKKSRGEAIKEVLQAYADELNRGKEKGNSSAKPAIDVASKTINGGLTEAQRRLIGAAGKPREKGNQQNINPASSGNNYWGR